MKPMLIVPPDTLSVEDIKKLDDNHCCVVVATDPAKVRFMDPLPAASSRTQMENAAIKLSRILIHGQHTHSGLTSYKGEIAALYVQCLVEGTPLSREGSQEEIEQRNYDYARLDEVRRIAREEARAERAKQKAQAAAATGASATPPAKRRGRPPKQPLPSTPAPAS